MTALTAYDILCNKGKITQASFAGMIASAFIFIFSLPSMLWSYQASILGGTLFFFVAMTGAVSVIVSFLLALYGAGAGAVYALSSIGPNSRIGGGRRGRPGYLGPHQD